MKRLIALSVALLVLMSGCTNIDSSKAQSGTSWYAKLLSILGKNQQETTVKLAENQKEVYGKVKDIYGNIMELQIGTMPSANGGAGNAQNAQGENSKGQQNTQGSRQQNGGMPDNFAPPTDGEFSPPSGGTTTNGTSKSTQGKTGTGNNTARTGGTAGLRQSAQINHLTGEEKTYTIPVTTPVFVKTTTGTSKLSFNQITKSKVVKLIVETDASGNENLVSIQILQ
ncbi:MAG TPA: hypothetical protein DCP97_05750 [Ruminococcaceae bacterium]|nr:hypothetical protein [Oscillospiraceae bacterium]